MVVNAQATSDLEWYDPAAVTTKNGKLEILMTREPINGFEYRSGFLSSWNKFWSVFIRSSRPALC